MNEYMDSVSALPKLRFGDHSVTGADILGTILLTWFWGQFHNFKSVYAHTIQWFFYQMKRTENDSTKNFKHVCLN
jgi:hypothetical protein